MPLSDRRDPCDPRTEEYLRKAVRSLPQGGPSLIKIVKRASRKSGDKGGALGVLPASFNPPTVAHQALVSEATKVVPFDEILLILDQQAMDKELFGAPLADRLLMLVALFGADPQISLGISNRGLFLEKVEALHKIYPHDRQIYFIVGHDTIARILDPMYYEDRDKALCSLFSQARFLVANRKDCGELALRELFGHKENRLFAPRVSPLVLPPPLAWLSSSAIRQQLAWGRSVKGLVPPQIEEFVLKRGFYSRQGE
jgi:nicotinic acid mononucleotide adenylyltransferase